MSQPIEQTLDQMGLRVRYHHQRVWLPIFAWPEAAIATLGQMRKETQEQLPQLIAIEGWELSPFGGRTICDLVNEAGELVAQGIATVHYRDHFDKRIGRVKSLGRAIGNLKHGAVLATAGSSTFSPPEIATNALGGQGETAP